MTRWLKILIGIILLIVGIWVCWNGLVDDRTGAVTTGYAALFGGFAFLISGLWSDPANSGRRSQTNRRV